MEITLYYKSSGSDKIYSAQVIESEGGYKVNFQYGRRGASLASGTKTAAPVSLEEANKVFAKLVKEKQAKGYTEGESGTPYVGTDKEDTGIHPQLLNPIEETELEQFLSDDNYVAQEKFDGKRVLLKIEDGKVTGINRRGLKCGIPETVEKSVSGFKSMILDGELEGDFYHIFDILELEGKDVRGLTYLERYALIRFLSGHYIESSYIARSQEEKRNLLSALKDENAEGIVFKLKSAPYESGRPNSGGSQRKFKFYEEATCRVKSVSGSKRSFSVEVKNGDSYVEVGNCTVPANKEIPSVGNLTEIRYLYCYEGGSLYQPFYKELRDDKTEADEYSSLKFKG